MDNKNIYHKYATIFNSAVLHCYNKSSIPKLFSFLGQTASIVFSVIASFITLLYLFFILLDYERLAKNFIRIFPKKQRPFWTDLMQDVESELNNYIRGQGLVGLTMGIFILYWLYHYWLSNSHRNGNINRCTYSNTIYACISIYSNGISIVN